MVFNFILVKTYCELSKSNLALEDEDFEESFISLWTGLKLKQARFSDIADWWEMEAKPAIRKFCAEFSKQRKDRRNDSKAFWFAYLKIVLEDKNWMEVARVKTKLMDMLQEDAFGYVVRSRFKNNVSEEAASLFHANREMVNAKSNSLSSLKINNKVESNQEVIEEEVTNFFMLYLMDITMRISRTLGKLLKRTIVILTSSLET